MPVLQVNTAATIQIKRGAGKVWGIAGVAAGTTFAFQLKDGPDTAGNTQTIMGQTSAVPVIAGVQYLGVSGEPLTFRDGLQIVTTGTPGELEIQYD